MLVGNGILKAMNNLNWVECSVIWRNHNEQEAIEESLADNRAYELGKTDYKNLSESILELDQYNWDMETIGYKPEEIENIIAHIRKRAARA